MTFQPVKWYNSWRNKAIEAEMIELDRMVQLYTWKMQGLSRRSVYYNIYVDNRAACVHKRQLLEKELK